MQLSTKHLLGIKDLLPSDIALIVQTAQQFKEVLQISKLFILNIFLSYIT